MFRVLIFSAAEPSDIAKLARRINREVPEAHVCGVLYERRPGKPLEKRIQGFVRNLRQPQFIKYAAGRIANNTLDRLKQVGSRALQFVHAAAPSMSAGEDLEAACASLHCQLLVTPDYHSEESLAFARNLGADLGIVYGTRILKPQLFTIPRLGSINIHKRKVPDYRGGGPVGLWELLDGQSEIGVTVHEVVEKLDAGAIIHAATIPIQDFDTLASLSLKAHVVANDLLVRSVSDYARGTVRPTPQDGQGRVFRNPSPQQLAEYEKQFAANRPRFSPGRGRSSLNLSVRSLAGLPIVTMRNRFHRRNGRFPVMILFHHIVTDRPHSHGVPTEHFMKHIAFLRRHYDIVALRDAIEMLRTNTVRRPSVVLTFDDGYADNFLTLRAIRERFDVPMTLFVSTSHITNRSPFAHDIGREGAAFTPLMWDHLRQMQNEGFEIGSHTRSHFDCGSRDMAALHSEIVGSKEDLERHLGKPVDMFSFPFGQIENISPEAQKLANETYSYVFSAYGGSNFASADGSIKHLYRWPHANDVWELELTLQAFLDFGPKSSPAQALRAAS
jgi:peptidoglycan/xylan/chitin deacetylase (PgdA/CDA1 family)/folate-dependent phosphoribosylglycinamide formyltransferase PurN